MKNPLFLKKDDEEKIMRILILGAGYVGLVTATCFAEMGYYVTCLDIDEQKVKHLQKGNIPIYEPRLQEMVIRNIQEKRLFFTHDYEKGLEQVDFCFIAVPTPSQEDGSCNTTYIEQATVQIATFLKKDLILVNKSTAPIGTAKKIQALITQELAKRGKNFSCEVVSNPEFLKEGTAVEDCMKPDRIILGVDSERPKKILQELYAPFTVNHDRILWMDSLSAEMTKYAANAMLATRISFMNEIATICQLCGADIHQVRVGIGSDPRIGYSFLYAGVGYGGSCFPKDIRALQFLSRQLGYEPNLLKAVESINEAQKKKLAQQILSYFSLKDGMKGKIIAVWGLAFKPDTDDVRESPALSFIRELQKQGAILRLFDPIAMENAQKALPSQENLIWCQSEKEAAENADAIALLTEWKQFRILDFSPIKDTMRGKAIFDGRNQYKASEMRKKGFDYIGIGTH